MKLSSELNSMVTQTVQVSSALKIIRVQPNGWKLQPFKAGQFLVLGLYSDAKRCPEAAKEHVLSPPEKMIKRAYSIASGSTEEIVEFYITLVHSGQLTPRLFALNIGDKVWMSPKAVGAFTLEEVDENLNIILIATGTGVAPYMSMLRTDALRRKGKIMVIHGASNSWDLGYSSELKMLANIFPGFSYLPTIIFPENEPLSWTGDTRFIEEIWQSEHVTKHWQFKPKPENTHIFLCGNPNMIGEMKKLLGKDNFKVHKKRDPGQVHIEVF